MIGFPIFTIVVMACDAGCSQNPAPRPNRMGRHSSLVASQPQQLETVVQNQPQGKTLQGSAFAANLPADQC